MEKTNGNVCANYIRLKRQAYVSDCELRCRNCENPFNENCEQYFPIHKAQVPINKGSGLVVLINFNEGKNGIK